MARTVKSFVCALLCMAIISGFAGCSGTSAELTEENVNATVQEATTALQQFDSKKLEKYVDSETLAYILKLSKGHDQFGKLGVALFENLTMQVESIDLEAKTVTVSVNNKNMVVVASNFTRKLLNEHNKFQLVNLLGDDEFLDTSLGELVGNIEQAEMNEDSQTVTLKIEQGKKNLVLVFDDEAENAVSGGALTAIKKIIG